MAFLSEFLWLGMYVIHYMKIQCLSILIRCKARAKRSTCTNETRHLYRYLNETKHYKPDSRFCLFPLCGMVSLRQHNGLFIRRNWMTIRKRRAGAKRNSKANRKSRQLSTHQQEERIRGLAAINLYRRGDAKSLSAAARAERTTVRAIRTLLPAAIAKGRSRGRIRVKASDPYSQRVEIISSQGPWVVKARGSRQRELAGRHRATVLRVLQGKRPALALEQFRGKTIGGHQLISDFARLSAFAHAGILGQLDSLYVSPDSIA